MVQDMCQPSSSSLSLYAGVLSIGIGDTTASVFGSLFGTHKWPDVLGAVLSPVVMLAVIFTSLIEAFTLQIDNLILPLYMFCLLSIKYD
ncbi:hypothetical protein KUTeg_017618 [Tegillarca granosa]|uniref:dolichol kinase n=1 Tax=Tegillarca granosa TaxID=220873 RepID=A0ABQ9EKX0_TEGGR|nr:hypothetical protein KUTeg_017618 [Tegillarca granosa]